MRKEVKLKTFAILVKGRVQGIGFRPFIYNRAHKLKLTGLVKNTKQGVLIKCQGGASQKLINNLKSYPLPLAKITDLHVTISKQARYHNFTIQKSLNDTARSDLVQIMPDLAVCPSCTKDFTDKKNRRYFYPFTNCTQCGPRYSIIRGLPYDRPRTTMKSFNMCPDCLKEYTDPTNRRFHAQPNACPVCGPQLTLTDAFGKVIGLNNNIKTIRIVQKLLSKGKIVAIRSIGGFQLACDAKSNVAVLKLRRRKNRPAKPLAMMCKDIITIQKLCYINKQEFKILKSQIAPIVLIKKKKNDTISRWIAPRNGFLGVMLPYTPLHKLLFNVSRETSSDTDSNFNKRPYRSLNTLVMTSANPKGAPIIANADEVKLKLNKVVDYILDHNRPIESRCDDSVVFDYKGPIIVRYSRGYVPEPLHLKNITLKPVLAFGSDLKNGFAIGKGDTLYLSPYIGDLIAGDSINFLFEMLEKYQKWFNFQPEIVACDLHPDYISARLAEQYAKQHRLKLVKVQHHFAHLAGVMAENGLTKPVIGLGFDGTGYGTDRQVWGSEFMVLDYVGFNRVSHLKYLPMVGGDVAITNPKLIAETYLTRLDLTESKRAESQNSNMVMTSSLARLFDAVASILGLCQHQSYEGEAPIALEAEANKAIPKSKHIKIPKFQSANLIDPLSILVDINNLKKHDYNISDIALYFHRRIIAETIQVVKIIGLGTNIDTVCLSGGVFQNRILLQGIESGLARIGFRVHVNRRVPINDGGIAFGQAVIAGYKK